MRCALAGLASAQSKLAPLDEAGYAKLVAAHKGKVVLVNFWAYSRGPPSF